LRRHAGGRERGVEGTLVPSVCTGGLLGYHGVVGLERRPGAQHTSTWSTKGHGPGLHEAGPRVIPSRPGSWRTRRRRGAAGSGVVAAFVARLAGLLVAVEAPGFRAGVDGGAGGGVGGGAATAGVESAASLCLRVVVVAGLFQ
jgi:hypothetical protein